MDDKYIRSEKQLATRDAIHSFKENEPNTHKIYNVAFVEQWLRERVCVRSALRQIPFKESVGNAGCNLWR